VEWRASLHGSLGMTQEIATIWDASPTPEQWAASNQPSDTLLWKDGLPRQVKDLLAIGHLVNVPVRVAGYHTSKSVRLPVGLFRLEVYGEETVYFFTRNNFYNVKAVVISSCPLTVDYGLVHDEMTVEQLAAERQRAYDYQSKNAKFDPTPFDTDAWIEDWCHDSIHRSGGKVYRCGTTTSCYFEGMEEAGVPRAAFKRYEHGRSMLAVEVDGACGLMQLVEAVRESVLTVIHDRRDKASTLAYWTELSAMSERRPYQEERLVETTAKLRAWGLGPFAEVANG
jgi:hypothetical protein